MSWKAPTTWARWKEPTSTTRPSPPSRCPSHPPRPRTSARRRHHLLGRGRTRTGAAVRNDPKLSEFFGHRQLTRTPMPREVIDTGNSKQFVRRNEAGQFTSDQTEV